MTENRNTTKTIYNFRLWLSFKFLKCGRDIHPEISILKKKIIAQQKEIGEIRIKVEK